MRGLLKCGSVAALFLWSGAALAEPIYLTCALDDRPTWIMDVQLNEAAGTASILYRHGGDRSIIRPAAFAPDRVTFDDYVLSRQDLSFSKDNRHNVFREYEKLPLTQRGKCVRDERKRAF